MTPAWHLKHEFIKKPYDVQVEAMRRAAGHEKYGFWCEMGLGKTALVLNDYVDQFSDCDTIFAISPNSFKMDWALAPSEWGLSEITTSVWPKEQMRTGTATRPHLNSINFEAVRSSGYDPMREIMDKRDCLLIVDESSAIKNFKSQTARAVLDLAKRAKAVRLLNGTPMTQNVLDLFPQLKALGELNGMNPYVFRNKFAMTGGFMGKQIVGVRNEDELHAIQERCSFRALKKDWSDLPEKIYVPMNLEMTNNQKKHYSEMLRDFYTMVNDTEFSVQMVINQQDKLRQITSGVLMDGDKFVLIDPPEKNPKINAALDILDSGPGKMIIVHMYTKMGHVIFDQMTKHGYNPAYIRGGMSPEEVIEEKRKFNQDSSCRVLVGQIQSASKAHTLLGGAGDDRCHKTFFHDLTFSLLDRKQMEDRNHRGAQDKAVLYYDPIMSPIDKAQMDALLKKQSMASLVVDAVRAMRGKLN